MHITRNSAAEIIADHRRSVRRNGRIRRVLGAGVSLVAMGAVIAQAQTSAQIARAQVVGAAQSCPVVLVNFNTALTMTSQSLSGDGRSLTVGLSSAEELMPPETAGGAQPSLSLSDLGAADVRLDTSGETPVLRVNFTAPVAVRVTQSGTRSLVIALSSQGDGNGCFAAAEAEPAATATGEADTAAADQDDMIPGAGITEDDVTNAAEAVAPDAALSGDEGDAEFKTTAKAAKLLERARAAITAGDHRRAIQILTNLLALPENRHSADAQELLGLSRERNGQLAHATAEYETYLEKYPDHQGVKRVRQRLAAILTSQAELPPVLRAANGRSPLPPAPGQEVSDEPRIVSIPRKGETFPPLGPQPGFKTKTAPDGTVLAEAEEEISNFRATVTVYYYLNELSTTFEELETDITDEDEEVLQNSLSFGLDMSDERKIGNNIFSWRIAGDYELDMNDTDRSRLNLSRFYGNIEFGEGGPQLRFGRQSRYDEGIGGRFDGVRFSYPVNEDYAVNAVLGMPVDRKQDPLFGGNRTVAGASLDYTGFNENTKLTAYVVGEVREGLTERLAFGLGGHYVTSRDSVYGNIEYDISFQKISNARLSYSRQFKNRSSVIFAFDYRHSPELALSSALQGQTVTTLTGLSAIYTESEMRSLAEDRASEIWTASLNYQRPINDVWQFNSDVSVSYSTGSPASGGVAAVPAPGWELYASAQAVGIGVFKDNDVVSLTGRYADTSSSELFLVDAYWRFNVTEQLRLKPRLKLAHRNLKSSGGIEQVIIPSVSMLYKFEKRLGLDFELEVGNRITNTKTGTTKTRSEELIIFSGFTKDF